MKSAVALALAFLSTLAVASHGIVRHHRRACTTEGLGSNSGEPDTDGWHQKAKGTASFTVYNGCQSPSCGGRISSGYTAAVNTRSFGATSDFGDACGRCFEISANEDPYTPSYKGPFGKTIVVKVNDLCPISDGNAPWCSQTPSNPHNQFGRAMHFDLCADSGADAFFPEGRGAMLGNYVEVSCDKWEGNGQCPDPLWNNWCLSNPSSQANFWPAKGCGNNGAAP